MDAEEFRRIRRHLGGTQVELARLLGLSPKAVQSFEQGWRRIPAHAERHLYFLVYLSRARRAAERPCWVVRNCSADEQAVCPAWKLKAGRLCWLTNGTYCRGRNQSSWKAKIDICRNCEVFPATWR